jgi:hypothetical protein
MPDYSLALSIIALGVAAIAAVFTGWQASQGNIALKIEQEQLETYREELRKSDERYNIDQKRLKDATLLEHWNELSNTVFSRWLMLQSTVEQKLGEFEPALINIYLNTSSFLGFKGTEHAGERWNNWAFDHLKTGYPDFLDRLENFNSFELKHNLAVSETLHQMKKELSDLFEGNTLKGIDDLVSNSDLVKLQRATDYFIIDRIQQATQEIVFSLKIVETNVPAYGNEPYYFLRSDDNGLEIAHGHNKESMSKLKEKIEVIREKHQKEHDEWSKGLEQDRTQLLSIQKTVNEIIFDLKNLHKMKGECPFEQELK